MDNRCAQDGERRQPEKPPSWHFTNSWSAYRGSCPGPVRSDSHRLAARDLLFESVSRPSRFPMAVAQVAILIVDDEELNRDALARRLQRHDYEVVAAKTGREAIELLGGR